MSDPSDLPPEPIVLYHYGEGSSADESPDPQDVAQEAIDVLVAREARELAQHADPLVRAAVAYQLAPHEAPFLLGDPDPRVRLAAARVCGAFPLLRVLLWDLKTSRRDPSEQVRQEVESLLAAEAGEVRGTLPTWATEAMIASPLFDDEVPAEGLVHPRLRVLPSGSARERGASASWATREILDRPTEEFVPDSRSGDSSEGHKTVARVHDANRQTWNPTEDEVRVDHETGSRVPPAPHGPATGSWELDPSSPQTDDPRSMTDKEST